MNIVMSVEQHKEFDNGKIVPANSVNLYKIISIALNL